MIIDRTETGVEARLEAAKRGMEWAWEDIYADLVGPVTGYLRSHGASEAEDLASEVFLQVARNIHAFEGDDSQFRSWVFVIAHRRLIDARRASGRQLHWIDLERMERDMPGGDVENEAFERLATDQVRAMLALLSEDQSRVITLRVIADLTLEETANVLGKRVTAVKALQRRGLAAMRAHLQAGTVSF